MLEKIVNTSTPRTNASYRGNTSFRYLGLFTAIIIAMTFALAASALAQPSVTQYAQGFEANDDWSGTTVARVASGTDGINSKSGGFHAKSFAGDFTRWGGYHSVFPLGGYTTSVAIYLNVSGGFANDTRFDYSSAINDTTGTHRRDFVFNGGFYTGPNRFVVSASNNAPGNPPGGVSPVAISSSGWYTFKHRFYDNGSGVLAVELSIIDSSNVSVASWTLSDSTDIIGSTVGGNRYGWFVTNGFPFLAMDDSDRSNLTLASINVSPAGSPTAADNDYTRINNAVQTIASGGTITLNGTFDWTEANAAASWALGSDGQTGAGFADDDYSIVPRPNLSGVTFTGSTPVTGPATGGAIINGPGDLLNVNLEGVFYFTGATDQQNWTISNIQFRNFDLAIGMFNGAGGIDSYNGTTIQNNYILIPNDLNATVAPADPNQNIGIHYSFGANQTISGNYIDTPGDGVSAAPNFSSVIGMQSNTSGGAVYDGLQIMNNQFFVTGAQDAVNPQTVLGFWENAHGHSSNITVSGNSFRNTNIGNNPAINLQRGFRVTSHSSGSTTVTYSGNRVDGANIGFQFLPVTLPGGSQPVVMTSNSIFGGATGVKTDTQGTATLTFNRIVGNSLAGVDNTLGGTVTAENNWWGCNYGQGAAGGGCPTTTNGTLGVVDSSPWLVLTTSASPTSLSPGGTSAINSRLTTNSALATPGGGSVSVFTRGTFTPTNGTVAPTGFQNFAAGVINGTFMAVTSGMGGVATTTDGQTVNAPININGPCVAVSTAPNQGVLRNTPVTVPVTTGDVTGRGATSFDFTLTYNPAVLTYTGVDNTGTVSSTTTVTVFSPSAGTLVISGFTPPSAPDMTGSGTLLNVNFTSIGAIGTTSLMNLTAFKYNENNPCTTTSNGTVTIISGTIAGKVTYLNNSGVLNFVPGAVLTASGAITQMSTTDANGDYSLSGLGNSTYTVTPSKTAEISMTGYVSSNDAARIAQHVVGMSPFPGGGGAFQSADVSGDGSISSFDASLIARYAANLPGSGSSGTWRFVPVSRSYSLAQVQTGASGQNYAAILMGDVTGNYIIPAAPTRPASTDEARPMRIGAPELSAGMGTEVLVPVSVQDTTGKGIISYQFTMTYDPTVLEPSVNTADLVGTISEGMSATVNSTERGRLTVVVFGANALVGAGDLLKLRFNVIGDVDSGSDLSWEIFAINEGGINFETKNGRVVVRAASDDAAIKGRVVSAAGQPVSGATVTITDTTGQVRTTRSSSLGNFAFADLTVGQTYTVNVNAKRFTFAPRIVSVTDDAVSMDMIAEQ